MIIPWTAMTNLMRTIAVIKSKSINRLTRILHVLLKNLHAALMIVFHPRGFAILQLIVKMDQMKMLHIAGLKLTLCISSCFFTYLGRRVVIVI